MSASSAGSDVRNVTDGIRGPGVLGKHVAVQIQAPADRVDHDVLENRSEHPCGFIDLGLALLRQPNHLGVATSFEVEHPLVAPTMLVVADESPVRIRRESRLPGSR